MLPALSDCTRLLDTFFAGRNPRTLAAYQADLEDFRRFMETWPVHSPTPPTVGEAVKGLLEGPKGLANVYVIQYRWQMRERGLQVTTINRRLSTLRSLVKLANTQGLVTWTLSVEDVPAQPYRDIGEPGREGFRALLEAAGAQPGSKGCAMWRYCGCCTIWACAAARRCGSTSRMPTCRETGSSSLVGG